MSIMQRTAHGYTHVPSLSTMLTVIEDGTPSSKWSPSGCMRLMVKLSTGNSIRISLTMFNTMQDMVEDTSMKDRVDAVLKSEKPKRACVQIH